MDSKSGVVGHCNMNGRSGGGMVKRRTENGDGRFGTTEECDSTTEPPNSNVQFRAGDVVWLQENEQLNFCTVGMTQGNKVKVVFDDMTEKWVHNSKVKKFDEPTTVKEEVEEVKLNSFPHSPPMPPPSDSLGGSGGSSSNGIIPKKKPNIKCDVNGQVVQKENHQVTCGSCGTQKIITRKKAMEFSPYTSHQYNCRKCINKSKTSKNNGVPITAHYIAANSRQGKRSSETNGGGMDPNRVRIMEHGMTNGGFRHPDIESICLHCRNPIVEKISLQCTMCERPCHPSCLALTPPPLPGDTFWSILCHMCGTQKANDSPESDNQKLYSSRRSIGCWSDVAHLLLNCLGSIHPSDKYFDLDKQIIPFWDQNVNRLHLPRQYKSSLGPDRRSHLLTALTNANLRFVKDDKKKTESWGIKESTHRNMPIMKVIKPPAVSTPRGVNSAGFPISVRGSNPEVASVAANMSNIAQTIATQAAANKAAIAINQGVPTPKNSPCHISPKSSSSLSSSTAASNLKSSSSSSSGAPIGPGLGNAHKKASKQDCPPVARKSGSECNNGFSKNNIWPQPKYVGGAKFLPELPRTNASVVLGVAVNTESSNNLPLYPTVGPTRSQQILQQAHQKHITLQPSAGGAARVTGISITTSLSSSATTTSASTSQVGGGGGEANNKKVGGIGSYPVRKNGSPILNKSIRLEPVERKKEVETSSTNAFIIGSDDNKSEGLIRESPGFTNQSIQHRIAIKRKLSNPAKNSTESSSTATSASCFQSDDHDVTSVTKKVKLGNLPSSTDVTSKRLPTSSSALQSSTLDSSGKSTLCSTTNISQKRDRSPLQRLTELLRIGNGVLTIARVKQTEYGTQSEPLIPSTLADAMDQGLHDTTNPNGGRSDSLAITYDKQAGQAGKGYSNITPTKNSQGATMMMTNGPQDKLVVVQDKRSEILIEEKTKDKNVTTPTSPRVFKHASVSTPGVAPAASKPSSSSAPVAAERKMRPVRLKRAVVTNAQAEKQSKEAASEMVGRKVNGKAPSAAAAAAAALTKTAKSRGRPKKIPFRQLVRRPVGNGILGHLNGNADNKLESVSTETVNEAEFSWGNSTIKDLIENGIGYRLGCLPRAPEGKTEIAQMKQSAIKHIQEELSPRPPSYWSNSSSTTTNINHSKKTKNQKSRRDLKDVDSYYINGSRTTVKGGLEYQVVWRDGQGFECSTDDEQELGIDFDGDYMYFNDYDKMESFFDRTPCASNVQEAEDDDDDDDDEGECDTTMTDAVEIPTVSNGVKGSGGLAATATATVITYGSSSSVKAEPKDWEGRVNGKKLSEKKSDESAGGGGCGEAAAKVGEEMVENDPDMDPIIIDLTDSP